MLYIVNSHGTKNAMKRQLILLAFFLFAGLVSLVGLHMQTEPDEIGLFIQDVGLAKSHPLRIKMYLRAGDRLEVKLQQERGLLSTLLKQEDIKNLEISLKRLSREGLQFGEEKVGQKDMAETGYEAKNDDYYELKLDYTRPKMVNFGAIEVNLFSSTKGDTLSIENLYVGNEAGNQPRIAIDFQEEDILIAKTDRNTANAINCVIPELRGVSDEASFWNHRQKMPAGGSYSLNLSPNNGQGQDISFVLERTRPTHRPVSIQGPPTAEDDDNQGTTSTAVAEGEDPMAALLKAMLEEMEGKDISFPESTGPTESLNIDLAPEMNLLQAPRACQEIPDLKGGQFWTYWLGTGRDPEAAYFEFENKYLGRIPLQDPKLTFNSMFHSYAFTLVEGKDLNAKADFPFELRDRTYREEFEYAVVPASQTQAFLSGDNYQARWGAKGIAQDHGNGTLDPTEKLYLCTCNHNRNTALRVFFNYEVFNVITVNIN